MEQIKPAISPVWCEITESYFNSTFNNLQRHLTKSTSDFFDICYWANTNGKYLLKKVTENKVTKYFKRK